MPVKQPLSNSITEGSIWKQLLLFFFPILMGSFFQQMYTMADTIIVGRALGTQALAAVGSSSSLINLVCGFFIGLSSGATVLCPNISVPVTAAGPKGPCTPVWCCP